MANQNGQWSFAKTRGHYGQQCGNNLIGTSSISIVSLVLIFQHLQCTRHMFETSNMIDGTLSGNQFNHTNL